MAGADVTDEDDSTDDRRASRRSSCSGTRLRLGAIMSRVGWWWCGS